MLIEKYTIGIGDRFGRQGVAQLAAVQLARQAGVELVPVWNKSNREHNLIGTEPADTRAAAEAAIHATGWPHSYHLDADHIGLKTLDRFLPHCDFFTIDVADFIGVTPSQEDAATIRRGLSALLGRPLPELGHPTPLDRDTLEKFLASYAAAITEAGRIYAHIATAKGADGFIAEVSTDEAQIPQSPLELFLILGGLAACGVRVQTIAPKFTGRFNKGVDYVGDVQQFSKEFEHDILAVSAAIKEFQLPASLKLSVHSGSDKFSLYDPIRRLLTQYNCGLHLKTAGTTWLEEVIGLALSGGQGLDLAKEIAISALSKIDELCAPYSTVIDIDRSLLPALEVIRSWTGREFAAALAHEPTEPSFNPHFRQLVHVSFKIAAAMGPRYLGALELARETIARCVTDNLWRRHIKPLFVG